MSDLYLKQMEIGPMENFVYLVGSKDTREVFVVDPAWQVDTVMRTAKEEGLKIIGALISHYHFDHTNGIEELLESLNVPIYVNKKDVPYMAVSPTLLKAVDSGTKIKAGNVEIEMVHTPGHTPGSQCFHVRDHLISGDTLFINACGRTDLPGGDYATLIASIRTVLFAFGDDAVVYPGHGPQTTIGEERRTNPFLVGGPFG